jgi:hypothetical protein
MLEKNEYPVKFGDKEKKELKELIGSKKNVVFQLVNSLSRVDRHTGKRIWKRSHRIESTYVGSDTDGNTEEFTYFKTKRQDKKNNNMTIYTPEFIPFEKNGRVKVHLGDGQNQNLDLFWWLMHHPRRANNKNGYGSKDKRPLFYLVDNNAEALEYAQKKRASAKLDTMLWDDDHKIDNETAETIAQALQISVIDMNDSAIRKAIEDTCRNNPQRFLNLMKNTGESEIRANIQKAKSKGILSYDAKSFSWSMTDPDTKNKAKLCSVRKTDEPVATLVFFLKNEDKNKHYDRVLELVSDKKKSTKGKAKTETV